MTIHSKTPDLEEQTPQIAVIGVGGAGGNAVNNMIAADLQGVRFIAANTDAQALTHSRAETKIQLGIKMTEGLGAGSKPEIGAAAAEESIDDIKAELADLHMVFITAGMGGGTGTGAAPVIAKAAREVGVLTVGVVTKPFHFEGQRRMTSAEFGIELLAEQVDTLIVIPNQNLFKVAVVKTTFSEAFAMADQVLHDGISCITDVMVKEGIINLDFADVNLVMQTMGKAMMGTGEAKGENRGREAAERAISNPLLDDVTLHGARGLLVSITGGRNDLTLYEVDEAANRVREEIARDANIIIGTAFDESMGGTIRVSVVATGLDTSSASRMDQVEARKMASGQQDPSLAKRLDRMSGETAAPHSSGVASGVDAAPAQAAPAPLQPMADLSADDQVGGTGGVQMPAPEDFPPVGQAVLRARDERSAPVGVEQMKYKAGFFEKLAGFATGRPADQSPPQSVAPQTQPTDQFAASSSVTGADVIDPHAKGGALDSHMETMSDGSQGSAEHVEFPSFLNGSRR